MNTKVERYNESYKKAVANILKKELPEVTPLTVTNVLIDPSLRHGTVYLHTTVEIIKLIEVKRKAILTALTEHVSTRYTPKLTFVIDDDYLDRIDFLFEKIDQEKP